jgi:5-methylcytosine-specific restriction endonuclease McrA
MFDYKDKRWLHKREVILRRHNYLCQESKRYGKSVTATTVHHIYPVEFYPELAYEDWNLLPLSGTKHDMMHDRVTHEVTALGRYWQDKVKVKYDEWTKQHTPPT